MQVKSEKHTGGRPSGPRMPCGWKCGAQLTAREIREHFTSCPRRPADVARIAKRARAGAGGPRKRVKE